MFEALGRLTYRGRRWIVALAVAFVAFAGVWGTGVFGSLEGGGFEDPDSESSRASELAVAELGRQGNDVVVLYSADRLTVDDPAFERAVTGTLGALPDDLVVRTLTWYDTQAPQFVSEDRQATYAVLELSGDAGMDRADVLDAIEDDLEAPGLSTRVGGALAVDRDINEQVSGDIARAEMISMPILLVLLVVIFGSVAAASLPLAIGVTAILGAFTALRALTYVTDVSIFAVNLVTILGLGLAIDYGLFVVSRFREELAARGGAGVEDALARTMATAGRTVAVSGITVAVALAGLLIFPQVFLRSMGFGGVAAVLIAMIAALTLLPALLAMLGPEGRRAVTAPSVPAAAAPGTADEDCRLRRLGTDRAQRHATAGRSTRSPWSRCSSSWRCRSCACSSAASTSGCCRRAPRAGWSPRPSTPNSRPTSPPRSPRS